ncbi:hypothetical protein PR048_027318 [Dryococelus australis]|uniref:DUF5641 domain-containing protein n=1 Tax=Dryococelus australis TaxID=614101 RepID=A0ABQ9GF36_9NEOP|nr:hypothetical protein PR048_027318 [Dryococelus australis]
MGLLHWKGLYGISYHQILLISVVYGKLEHHLHREAGKSLLTFEEMTTLLTQIEACLNSRPLTVLSDDSNDPSFLSPGHFFIGSPLVPFPEPDLSDMPMKQLSTWQQVHRATQYIWNRWSKDYLKSLQQRSKLTSYMMNIKPVVVVLIKKDNLHPLAWRLAVITEIFPGKDGSVRVANVKTSDGILKRSIHILVIISIE